MVKYPASNHLKPQLNPQIKDTRASSNDVTQQSELSIHICTQEKNLLSNQLEFYSSESLESCESEESPKSCSSFEIENPSPSTSTSSNDADNEANSSGSHSNHEKPVLAQQLIYGSFAMLMYTTGRPRF